MRLIKYLIIGLLIPILVSNVAEAAWKYNPHTGKLDYYESGSSQTPWTSDINAASYNLYSVGNVGIGTTSVAYPLTVTGQSYFNGNVGIGTTTAGQALTITGSETISGNIGIGTTSVANPLTVTGAATISGNVGIGTTAPTASLHVPNGAKIAKRVITASDATSITPNSDNADITYQLNTQAAGTLTINADAGTPTNGQAWGLKIKSTNVQTFSWNSGYVGGTVALPTTTTGSSKIDYYTFIYDSSASKWDYSGGATGF